MEGGCWCFSRFRLLLISVTLHGQAAADSECFLLLTGWLRLTTLYLLIPDRAATKSKCSSKPPPHYLRSVEILNPSLVTFLPKTVTEVKVYIAYVVEKVLESAVRATHQGCSQALGLLSSSQIPSHPSQKTRQRNNHFRNTLPFFSPHAIYAGQTRFRFSTISPPLILESDCLRRVTTPDESPEGSITWLSDDRIDLWQVRSFCSAVRSDFNMAAVSLF